MNKQPESHRKSAAAAHDARQLVARKTNVSKQGDHAETKVAPEMQALIAALEQKETLDRDEICACLAGAAAPPKVATAM